MTTIAQLPPAPEPSDDETTLNNKMFATFGAFPDFIDQTNAVASETNAASAAAAAAQGIAEGARDSAQAAQAASAANANAAANYAGASAWVSGSYNVDTAARSPADHRIYIARTTGSKPTDPSLDPTNWKLATGNGLQLIPVTGTTATAAPGGRYVLKNAAATTLTAPPSPQAGDEFAVKWVNGRFDNVINWNGAKCEGLSDATTTLNGSPRGAFHFVYIDSTTGWGAI